MSVDFRRGLSEQGMDLASAHVEVPSFSAGKPAKDCRCRAAHDARHRRPLARSAVRMKAVTTGGAGQCCHA